jgi:hypothetical protein
MTRFHQKFDLVPKLSLRVQLEGLNINKKYRVLTIASQQRELNINVFHPFCRVSNALHCRISDALTDKYFVLCFCSKLVAHHPYLHKKKLDFNTIQRRDCICITR